jgi:hypothetical protein
MGRFTNMYGLVPEDASRYNLTFGEDTLRSQERLCELIIYISEKSRNDQRFGAIKLNKILYYSDFVSFREYGEAITGAQYMRLNHGPVPRHLLPVRLAMEQRGDIVIEKRHYYTQTQDVVIPLRPADTEIFSKRDLLLVDSIIEELWELDAHEVSVRSHKRAWRVANERDAIPYEAIFLSDEGLTEDDIEWAYEVASECGWINAPF